MRNDGPGSEEERRAIWNLTLQVHKYLARKKVPPSIAEAALKHVLRVIDQQHKSAVQESVSMLKKLYYRVDKRNFEPGNQIRTAGRFMSMHDPLNKRVEKALESVRPAGKMSREKCLMLFEHQNRAERFCAYARTNATLYTVRIAAGSVIHRGDMQLLGEMAWRMKRGKDILNEARRYWAGELTKDPCIEVLVPAGTIVGIVELYWELETDEPVCQRCGSPIPEEDKDMFEEPLCSWCDHQVAKDET